VFQLWGGVLADRVDRLRLLLVTQTLTTGALLGAFVLSALSLARVEHLLALAALTNTFRAFDEPSRMALVPQMVGRERLPNAIALGSIPWQAGRMIGPSITGVLIAAFGGTVGFGLAAGASASALAMYGRLRVQGHAPPPTGRRVMGQLLEGLGFVLQKALPSVPDAQHVPAVRLDGPVHDCPEDGVEAGAITTTRQDADAHRGPSPIRSRSGTRYRKTS